LRGTSGHPYSIGGRGHCCETEHNEERDEDVTDPEVLAAANARYEAFRSLLPKVLGDLETAIESRGVKLGWEIRTNLVAAAADATARLVADDGRASQA
jgi:hypothetical protein